MTLQGWVAGVREFDVDEFQHTHTAWSLAQGAVPYRDFFEHHAPLFHELLSFPLRWRAVDGNPAKAINFLVGARRGLWALSLGLLFLTGLLARRLSGPRAGVFAAALLASGWIFMEKSLEIRPDGLAVFFVLAGVWFHFKAFDAPSSHRNFFLSGLAWGLGLTTSPKVVFPLLGMGLFWLLSTQRGRWKNAIRNLGMQGLGIALPCGILSLFLWRTQALGAFWTYVIEWNGQWKNRFSPFVFIGSIARDNTGLLLGGLVAPLLFKKIRSQSSVGLYVAVAVASGLGLFLNPVPYAQSFLFVLPFWALGAAEVMERGSRWAVRRWPRIKGDVLLAASLIFLTAPGLLKRLRPFERNTLQLQLVAFLQETVPPRETVLDAWTGLGVFRPHAYFFPHLHFEIQRMLPSDWAEQLARDLQSGILRPGAILGDRTFRSLVPALSPWIDENYQPIVGNVLWIRRDLLSPPATPPESTPARR
jgi:4-amino-4-deoxy-L-arabinose transferase-like glycosyltransferase